jgi:nucleoside-diphosphate-sugar epimerase
MNTKRILVTGGTGYIGSALVPHLLQGGNEVHVFSRRAGALPSHPLLTSSIGDIRDDAALTAAMEGVTHIIHLAGVPDGKDEATIKAINEESFPALLQIAGQAGVKRFLFVSTSALYGSAPFPCAEDSPTSPLTPYAAQKLACEIMLRTHCPKGMDYTILRPGAVCGKAPAMRLDVLSHILTRDAVAKGTITVAGSGNYRPHVHMSDMVRACSLLLDAPQAAGEIFNLATENLTILELAGRVRDAVGSHVAIHELPTEDTRSYRLDSSKIMQKLGFSALSGVDSAINEVRTSIRSGEIADPYDLRYYPSKRQ